MENKSEEEIKEDLNDYLSYEIKSKDNLRKTREILSNIWVYSKTKQPELHQRALNLIEKYPDDVLGIHWCMMLLAYPVLSDLSVLFSNLSEYQEEITLSQIKNKMFDEWGERTTLFHSLDKIIQTLKDMEILYSEKPGRYKVVKHAVDHKEIVNFMVLAALYLQNGAYYSVSDLSHIKQFFAFDYSIDRTSLFEEENIVVSNFGGNQTVSLR
ncbi:MAG: hypothetical protein IJI66_05785 [Erysipelotrichaceae bacterium]|nr:hypothetical protein [Erysipelotrichaceae bacterium]